MSKIRRITVSVGFVLLLSAYGWSQASQTASANPTGFDRLKTLVGKWESKSPEGVVNISYRLVSGGSALMETIKMPGEEMITMYHRDGNAVVMTHYCTENNQPRMRAVPSSSNELKFDLVDVSNLSSPDAGHMRGLTMIFEDANHLTSRWTYRSGGKDQVFEFKATRKS